MNASTLTLSWGLPCGSSLLLLSDVSLIGATEASSSLFLWCFPACLPASKRSNVFLSPRLSIPFAIPFEARVNIFQYFIVNDKHNIRTDIRSFDQFHSCTRATVHRGLVAEDGFDKHGKVNLK